MNIPKRHYYKALVLDTSTDVIFEFRLSAADIPTAKAAVADLMRPYLSSTTSGFDRILKVWVGPQPLPAAVYFPDGVKPADCNPPHSDEWEPLHGTSG